MVISVLWNCQDFVLDDNDYINDDNDDSNDDDFYPACASPVLCNQNSEQIQSSAEPKKQIHWKQPNT